MGSIPITRSTPSSEGEAPSGATFASRVVAWQQDHGRHDLPWQGTRDPYRIWVSEIMLQQTQVAAVIPYYQRFLARFPHVTALAEASLDEVMSHWSGLGYYARARHLHQAARHVVEQLGGRFPGTAAGLAMLPGVGRSTAAAVAVFAHGERAAILDGNVRRVLARAFAVPGWPGEPRVARQLWTLAERLLPPAGQIRSYTQGLMDLGSLVCVRGKPRCDCCPVADDCVARRHGLERNLPEPRPRSKRPVREAGWLVLVCHEHAAVLLERRPGTGVWGGLWSLPEFTGAHWTPACARLGLLPGSASPLPVVEHGFTHFTLRARPWLLSVTGANAVVTEAGDLRWWPLAEAVTAGTPVPVRTLLRWLFAQSAAPASGMGAPTTPDDSSQRR